MCTVTYIPPVGGKGFILTSNRDERVARPTLAPEIYPSGSVQLCYPRDERAGGSWIAAGSNGRVACLLNGGFEPHEKLPRHTHSRGRVLVELVASGKDPMVFFSYSDLNRTEPFTVVTIDTSDERITGFSEFVWDGSGKYMKQMDPSVPRIWSSVTLYTAMEREQRRTWFSRFLSGAGTEITSEKVLDFHSGRHTDDDRINLIMQRDDQLRTVSISQVSPEDGMLSMRYLDLVEHSTHVQKI